MADVVTGLMEIAGEGLLRERTGRGLADVLDELPGFLDALRAGLTRLAEFMTGKLHDADLAEKITEMAGQVSQAHGKAEEEAARFRQANDFWLSDPDRDPGGSGGSGVDAMAEALGPGLVPEDGTELTGTLEGMPVFATSLAGQLRMIAEWAAGSGDAATGEALSGIAGDISALEETATEADGLYFKTYEFWIINLDGKDDDNGRQHGDPDRGGPGRVYPARGPGPDHHDGVIP